MLHATIGRMAKAPGIRRFLRFSLRSLLLVILAVAAWLGYEVHQARTVEGQAEAIRALGGEVEFEPSPWSLLRFVEPQTYGRRIVVAEIPGPSVGAAIKLLIAMPYLRTLGINYDGTSDLHTDVEMLHGAVPQLSIEASSDPFVVHDMPTFERAMKRLSDKMENGAQYVQRLLRRIKSGVRPTEVFPGDDLGVAYDVRQLADGTVVELFLANSIFHRTEVDRAFAILIVGDRAVDGAMFEVRTHRGNQTVELIDVDGDGTPDVGFVYSAGGVWAELEGARQIPGDARYWLGLYKIERAGFRSLLPEERLKE